MQPLKTEHFHYELPDRLIAQYPLEERTASRMLVMRGAQEKLVDTTITSLPDWLKRGDLLLLNDTQVIPARLFAKKERSGGRVEILLERFVDEQRGWAHLRASKSPSDGTVLLVEETARLRVVAREGALFLIENIGEETLRHWIDQLGHIPLPPYIKRSDEKPDRHRYQTVYAKHAGAIAAPTAGLHFSPELMTQLSERGVDLSYITLHVGSGTFQPVRTKNLEAHTMHSEWFSVSEKVCQQVESTHQRGGRVVAVGTTVLRALEAASALGSLQPYEGDTDIFIYPGYEFKSGVDLLLTNFHLPQSTLLMLVSAFVGREEVLKAYAHAVKERYRFFSYGDAMLISR